MSISRLTASLASVTNEVTVAAAALNFDFSLVKIQSPEEFRLTGGELSANRRNDVEGRRAYITARKLGALFNGGIPPFQTLVKAYGVRASEISSSPNVNPEASGRDGVFAAHVGADATTIWTAATSGTGTIAVHLLACLLARLWTGSEETSLWTEIVQRRRQEIAARFDHGETIDFPTLSVARQEFTRVQLADWDASARDWLRAADNAKPIELKQLLLIVAFGSVISHWTGYGEDLVSAAEFFLTLWDAVSYAAADVEGSFTSERERRMAQAFLTTKSNWMHILVESARLLIEAEGTDQQVARQLVKLGLRRGSDFLTIKLPSFFGLINFKTLFGIL